MSTFSDIPSLDQTTQWLSTIATKSCTWILHMKVDNPKITYPEDEIGNQLIGELSHDLTIGDPNQVHNHTFIGKLYFYIFKLNEF
jgi:hypothetical protein